MSKHVLIVGGGVVGLCAAYYCARRGNRVTVVDRDVENGNGCSYGNAGMIVPSHIVPLAAPGMLARGLKWTWNPESPFYIRPRLDWGLLDWGVKFWRASTDDRVAKAAPLLRDLHFASRACFEELSESFEDDFGFTQHGLLMLCKTPHVFDEEAKAAQKVIQLGVPAEVLDSAQTALRDPSIKMDVAGSVYFPKDCHFSPNRFMAELKKKCYGLGVRFYWQAEVEKLIREGNRIAAIRIPAGELEADEFVICGGSWSPNLTKQIGIKLPMQAGKGYSLTLPTPRQLPNICSILTEARVAVTPMGNMLRLGGTMEFAGLDTRIDSRRVRGIIRSVPKYFPEFQLTDFENIKPWSGLRPCSPDGLPYLGRTAKFKNLVISTGHAMMGMSLGPISGQIVASIIADEKIATPIDLLAPDRYTSRIQEANHKL
ncbi:MAG: FAD-dependent oxidoreductase [Pirellulaceae bacterium]|nr:FAD-dependent oxidoreductase [Pirellulaceae bacterium]